jgi:hypothetical protein
VMWTKNMFFFRPACFQWWLNMCKQHKSKKHTLTARWRLVWNHLWSWHRMFFWEHDEKGDGPLWRHSASQEHVIDKKGQQITEKFVVG